MTPLTKAQESTVAEIIVELSEAYRWSLSEAIEMVSEITKRTKAEILSAWLFADRYGNPTV